MDQGIDVFYGIVFVIGYFGGMDECCMFQVDVDECCLYFWQYLYYLFFVDIVDDVVLLGVFDMYFLQDVVFYYCYV